MRNNMYLPHHLSAESDNIVIFFLNSKLHSVSNHTSHFELPEKFLCQLMDAIFGTKGSIHHLKKRQPQMMGGI